MFHHELPHEGSDLSSEKEVIQPQVPLRLPCYDLVPITELAVGACPQKLDRRLRALPAFVA
jgi:hypothetical protein